MNTDEHRSLTRIGQGRYARPAEETGGAWLIFLAAAIVWLLLASL